ncbi:hypothetical protein D3C74_404650 [compost metagenome]
MLISEALPQDGQRSREAVAWLCALWPPWPSSAEAAAGTLDFSSALSASLKSSSSVAAIGAGTWSSWALFSTWVSRALATASAMDSTRFAPKPMAPEPPMPLRCLISSSTFSPWSP